MEFIPTQARYHPLYGLTLKNEFSPWYSARTKYPILELGVVTLTHAEWYFPNSDPDIPYKLTFTYGGDEHTIPATRDPVALELALKAHNSELPTSGDDWVDIPIPNQ